ncbi:polycomb protein SUZ12 [Neocloeon triangulifer]|uniref:polycomb protein SUZ12 n=1 Tax=Neocloeon triangulifer TaxID=2078957 RepID=UPI00286EBD72|nr:polycomb protein SUZ12 [Neocloeon triangulifer]
MPPKKRDKDNDSAAKSVQMDQMNHELFLQAFEKPTQIYRFLKTRSQLSAIFLPRTLSFMKSRMSRSHKGRKDFKVNNILAQVVANKKKEAAPMADFMTITFLGIYDKKLNGDCEPVNLETILHKVCHKKRKDVTCPSLQVVLGESQVPLNPSEEHPPTQAPTVSIPTDSFTRSNNNLAKSFNLMLKALNMPQLPVEMENGEPAAKRRRRDDENIYTAELLLFDKNNHCNLVAGDYELALKKFEVPTRTSKGRVNTWDNALEVPVELNKGSGQLELFRSGPVVKFRLNWASEASSGMVERPRMLESSPSTESTGDKENDTPTSDGQINASASSNKKKEGQKLQIVYQFLYNNNSRQQTEACDDLHCPWCSLNCGSLYALLKHLKLNHPRFCFTYVPLPDATRIDVCINEYFDGSYSGNAIDVIAQPPGLAFSRDGPVRRTSITNVLVCRPKRQAQNMMEFLEPDDPDFENQRSFTTGHNRLYHHTETCLPIFPKEMDEDSEEEYDPPWLQKKTTMMIDEFTDVNEGEKELMKMWNLHVMKQGYVGDCQIPLAVDMFIEVKGEEIIAKNLFRNFVVHMSSLFDFGLISAVGVYTTLQKLLEKASNQEAKKKLTENWKAQREHWQACQKPPVLSPNHPTVSEKN